MKKKEKTVCQIIRFRGKIEAFLVSIDEFAISIRYTCQQGNRELLPDMNVGRYNHGCAAFTKETEKVFMLQMTLNL